MSGPTPRRILRYVCQCLRLKGDLQNPGDCRSRAQIPARHLVWSVLIGYVLRESSFHAIEALVCSTARRALAVGRDFGDDALAYFSERLDPEPTRQALAGALTRAKRNKAFDDSDSLGWLSMARPWAAVRRKAAGCAVRSRIPRERSLAIAIMS